MIQVVGHFYKYDTFLDKNILVKEGLFLCVDKVINEDGSFKYLLNVVDAAQEYSFCQSVIASESSIQL